MDLKCGENAVNILIIDDVTINLVTLTEIIKGAGFNARPVTSVRQAMQAISILPPQLILLDITMPDIDGFEYCQMLKKDIKTREIPVIFISGLSSVSDRVRGFECGAVDFIVKPFEQAEILSRVNTHLKGFKMQQELKTYNQKLYRLVNQQFYKISMERKNLVYALAKLAEARDNIDGSHLQNVGKNCRLLAISLQFTPKYEKIITSDFIDTIEQAAALHDIGKVLIPDRILLKQSKLTMEERKIMMTHTIIGARTLMEIDSQTENNEFIKMAIDIAYSHHEFWNGNGYPLGLSGTEIPLAARIMSIVDTYDALICNRCYKEALSHEKTMEILLGDSGKRFDPDIISILEKVQRQMYPFIVEKRECAEQLLSPFDHLLKQLDHIYRGSMEEIDVAYFDIRR